MTVTCTRRCTPEDGACAPAIAGRVSMTAMAQAVIAARPAPRAPRPIDLRRVIL
ncbi:MAG TPA: hypothetical protein VFN65_08940 [Solirubrobacteraceae bacterium]|nr:hypothetical protein [Solirubrobacteraceae bacterium]